LYACWAEIARIWLDNLRYGFFERHEIRQEAGRNAFEFVTQTGHTGIYVTGRIEVHDRPEP